MKYGWILFILLSLVCLAEDKAYQSGAVRLERVAEYGSQTPWSTLFTDEGAGRMFDGSKQLGEQNLTVAEDGSVYVSNTGNFLIYQFDADGSLVRKFQNPDRIPADNSPLNRRPEALSILDNRLLLVCETTGINVFDLNGNRQKLYPYDYSVHEAIPLGGDHVALVGSVSMSNGYWKSRLALQSFPEGKEKEILAVKSNINQQALIIKKENMLISTSNPFSRVRLFARALPSGELLLGEWHSPDLWIYDANGGKRLAVKLDRAPTAFPDKKKAEYIANLKKGAEKNPEIGDQFLKELEKKSDFFPSYLPYYAEIFVDGQGNILVFDLRDDDVISFQAFSTNGEKLGNCTLDTGDVTFPKGFIHQVVAFHQDVLYALAALKSQPKDLRLIKAKLISH